jgi:uncharacterized protein with HEPN domain
MKNDDDIRLRHMLDAATEALGFTSGRQREDLEADRQLTWALIKAIEIIAEAAGQLSEETKNRAQQYTLAEHYRDAKSSCACLF